MRECHQYTTGVSELWEGDVHDELEPEELPEMDYRKPTRDGEVYQSQHESNSYSHTMWFIHIRCGRDIFRLPLLSSTKSVGRGFILYREPISKALDLYSERCFEIHLRPKTVRFIIREDYYEKTGI